MTQPIRTRGEGEGNAEATLADEVRRLGTRTSPQDLERRGVRQVRQVTVEDLHELVARTVDRALAGRGEAAEARNAIVEESHAALVERAGTDPAARCELLERRLRKLAEALDRSERALANVLDDVDTGLPAARRYVESLPDDHPLRTRADQALARLAVGRRRANRPEPTQEERRRATERRSLLAALAAASELDDDASDDRDPEGEAPRTPFSQLGPDDLRLRMEDARPHKGFGWRASQFRRLT